MKKFTGKRLTSLFLSCTMLIGLCACGDSKPPAAASPAAASPTASAAPSNEVVANWDFVVLNSLTHPSSQLCQEFADRIQEASDGRIQITVRAPGELAYSATDYLVAVGDGSVQVADVGSGCFGVLKAGAMPCLPYLANNLEDFNMVMDVLQPQIEEELSEYGAKMLFYYTWPAQSVWTKEAELTSLTDIKGMKIRTINNELSSLVDILDGTPVSIAGSEVPTALQTGVVDGVITSAYGLGGAGWQDSLKYGLIANCQIIPDYMCINQAEFDALPEDLQKVVTDVSAEFQDYMCQSMFEDEAEWREKLQKDASITLNTVSDEETAQMQDDVQSYWDTWGANRGGNCVDLLAQVRTALGK